jgi:hypothetical protein
VRPSSDETIAAFSPMLGATHLALALHFGGSPPGESLLVEALMLQSVPFDERYRVRLTGREGFLCGADAS